MNEYFAFQISDDDDMSAFILGYRTKLIPYIYIYIYIYISVSKRFSTLSDT